MERRVVLILGSVIVLAVVALARGRPAPSPGAPTAGFLIRRIWAAFVRRPGAAVRVPYDSAAIARSPTITWIGHSADFLDSANRQPAATVSSGCQGPIIRLQRQIGDTYARTRAQASLAAVGACPPPPAPPPGTPCGVLRLGAAVRPLRYGP